MTDPRVELTRPVATRLGHRNEAQGKEPRYIRGGRPKLEVMEVGMRAVTFTRSADLSWEGDVVRGSGRITVGTGAFAAAATFPTLRGEPPGATTPEELLAASHAVCFGIGLRSVIARRGGSASKILVRATLTADKGPEGIRLRRSHLSGVVEGLQGIDAATLSALGSEAERECTISTAIRGAVQISHDIRSTEPPPDPLPSQSAGAY